jgi:hypothetical protein
MSALPVCIAWSSVSDGAPSIRDGRLRAFEDHVLGFLR